MNKVRINRTSTSPIGVPTTVRRHDMTILTSLPAGKMVPIAAIPVLREDAARVRLGMAFQAMETADMLINEINVNVMAYFVPTLAFERFTGMDDLNRSWEGKSPRDTGGLPVVPFIENIEALPHGEDEILRYLGKHAQPGTEINSAYHEAYNLLWNFRAKNRSPDITERERLDRSLAPAFWHHTRFGHIVPDFDQAIIDGNVALGLISQQLPVRGLALMPSPLVGGSTTLTDQWTGQTRQSVSSGTTFQSDRHLVARQRDSQFGGTFDGVYAELQQGGITISLANIDLARKTQAFAQLRRQYSGHDDDYIIDMLMDGLTVPEQMWKQPIPLQERHTIFGMSQRYATNGDDLAKSVVNGATMLEINCAIPRCPTGGVIMIVAECTPGQLFERGRDPYLHISTTEQFPHALRDMLDPEPVVAVRNDYIDVDHDEAEYTFGYAPLNHEWNFNAPQIGGRFFRPTVDAGFDEDRLRIWAVETQNPVLSEDFYLCTTMHTKPFVNPNQDPFELTASGSAQLTGLTQFGPVLIEASDDYLQVQAEAPTEKVVKGPPSGP